VAIAMLAAMKNLLITLGLALGLTLARAAPELSAEQARRDLRILQRALTELHAGLYRHASAEQLAAEFAAAQAAVADGASRAELYLLATRLAAAVRCGHTWTNPANQPAAVQALLGRQTLPLVLRWVEGRIRAVASASPAVPAGSELLAIQGLAPAQIVAALMPYLRADGGNDGKRLAQLDDHAHGGAMQRLFPLLAPPGPEGWRLTLAGGREVRAAVMTAAERAAALRAAGWREPESAWRLRLQDGTAVLSLPTFAFWGGGFDGAAFLEQAFAQLAERGVTRLVIDLRDNEGGDDTLGRALLSHLIATPYTQPGSRRESAYERVPYVLARHLDTWDFGFFDRTGQATRTAGRNWALAESPPRLVMPVARPFAGRVVALVGPHNSSAGHLLARDLKASAAAVLVGQPTGGNLRGLNGGQLAWVNLPASGVAVDIPLVAAFAPGDPPDAGVAPDVLAAPRWADLEAGIDTALAAALRLLEPLPGPLPGQEAGLGLVALPLHAGLAGFPVAAVEVGAAEQPARQAGAVDGAALAGRADHRGLGAAVLRQGRLHEHGARQQHRSRHGHGQQHAADDKAPDPAGQGLRRDRNPGGARAAGRLRPGRCARRRGRPATVGQQAPRRGRRVDGLRGGEGVGGGRHAAGDAS
jgi:hypothetical protein